jgi:hypothetical protein
MSFWLKDSIVNIFILAFVVYMYILRRSYYDGTQVKIIIIAIDTVTPPSKRVNVPSSYQSVFSDSHNGSH